MSAQVVQLRPLVRAGWSNRELGEFYRVESALIQAGLRIDTSCGTSDEGDPWFVFCRADDGEVIIHIARIDGIYILAGMSYAGVASGCDITAMVRDLIEKHPLVQMPGQSRGSKIFLHPAALLIAAVAAAFFKSSEARALSPNHPKTGDTRGEAARAESSSTAQTEKTIVIDAGQGAVVLSAILTALAQDVTFTDKAISAPNADLNSSVLDSSFLDSSVSSTEVTHAIGLVTTPQDLRGGGDNVLNFAPVEPLPALHHGVIADAIPLFTLLWDLAKTASSVTALGNETGHFSSSEHGQTDVYSLVLSVTFAPNRADSVLPVVQSASLSQLYSNADAHASSDVATTMPIVDPSQLDQLPSALITALKATSHTLIAIPEGGATPFATTLIDFLTHHSQTDALPSSNQPNSTIHNPTSTGLHSDNIAIQTPTGSEGVTPSNVASTNSAPHASIDLSPGQPSDASPGQPSGVSSSAASTPSVANVEMLVQEFFAHTPHFQTVTAGSRVVVYDIDAIMGHPSSELASVTFDFSDGSTLSLVGLPAALHHSVIV